MTQYRLFNGWSNHTPAPESPPGHQPQIVSSHTRQLKSSTPLSPHPYAIYQFLVSVKIRHIHFSDAILSSPHSHRASLVFGLALPRWGSQLLGQPSSREIPQFSNLSDVAAVNLPFASKWKQAQLTGSNGNLRVLVGWQG